MTKMMKRNVGFRVLTVFVALLVLCAGPLHVLGEAHAIVAEGLVMAGGVLLIGTILAASGVKFLSQTDLLGASRTLLDKIRETDPSTWTGLSRIIAPLCQAGVKGSEYVMRLSQDLWDKVVGAFKGDVIQVDAGTVKFGSSPVTIQHDDEFKQFGLQPIITDSNGYVWTLSHGEPYKDSSSWACKIYLYRDGKLFDTFTADGFRFPSAGPFVLGDFGLLKHANSGWVYFSFSPTDFQNSVHCSSFLYPITVGGPIISATGTVDLPDNTTHTIALPDMPTMADDGSITYPDLPLNPEANLGQVADLPGYSDVATVPLDLPINAETGKVITDMPDVPDVPDVPALPTLGDVIGAIGQVTGALEGVGTAAGSLANTATGIAAAIDNFFDSPSDFSLDFTGFQNLILKDRFPFSIPFDMVNCIRVFAASAEDFTFKIDLETDYFQIHHVVDLTPFRIPFAFFRYVSVIWFTWVLISKTRDVMKW